MKDEQPDNRPEAMDSDASELDNERLNNDKQIDPVVQHDLGLDDSIVYKVSNNNIFTNRFNLASEEFNNKFDSVITNNTNSLPIGDIESLWTAYNNKASKIVADVVQNKINLIPEKEIVKKKRRIQSARNNIAN
jgi:hypothetical protein